MRIYSVNGDLRWYEDGQAPAGAILHVKNRPERKAEEPKIEAVESKTKRKPANKSRKAGANK